MDGETYYEILEIDESATEEEIKESFRHILKQFHPDALPPGLGECPRRLLEGRFSQIQEAYQILGNKEKRRQYDALLNDLRDRGN